MKKQVKEELYRICQDLNIKRKLDKFGQHDWIMISKCQFLSEDFIEEFQNKISWAWISNKQKLSKNFIRKYQNRIHWFFLSLNRNVTNDIVIQFRDKLDLDYMVEKGRITKRFRNSLFQPLCKNRFEIVDI
jgi:hypothetical protein